MQGLPSNVQSIKPFASRIIHAIRFSKFKVVKTISFFLACVLVAKVAFDLSANILSSFYTYVLLFTALFFSPLVSSKLLFPYLVSPRRFYAKSLGIVTSPWVPPSALTSAVLTTACLYAYIFLFSTIVAHCSALKALHVAKKQVSVKFGSAMAVLGVLLYLLMCFIPVSRTYLHGFPIPFWKDVAMGLPMAILITALYIWTVEKNVLTATTAATTAAA